MPVDIILDHPRGRLFRRLLRGTAALLGAVLILAALIASSLLLFALIASLETLVSRHKLPLSGSSHEDAVPIIVILVIALAVAVMGFLLGLRLVRGKRRLVLFLRRFGFVAATHVLSFTVARATGRAWHLVTLDDLKVAAVGVRPRTRRLTLAIALISLIGFALVAYWLYGGPFERFLARTVDETFSQVAANESDPIKALIGGAIVTLMVGMVVGALTFMGAGLVMSLFGATMFFSFSSYRVVRRVEGSKAREIRSAREIEPVVQSVARGARRILGARLVVVRVAPGFWRRTVFLLARSSAAVIMDVSEPTENLLWEIEAIKPEFRSRWILVGRLDRVRWLTSSAFAGRDPLHARLAEVLEGEQVLAYLSDERHDMNRFARALRGKLEHVRAGGPRAH